MRSMDARILEEKNVEHGCSGFSTECLSGHGCPDMREKKCGAGRSDFLSERLSEHGRSDTEGEKCGTWMFRFFYRMFIRAQTLGYRRRKNREQDAPVF